MAWIRPGVRRGERFILEPGYLEVCRDMIESKRGTLVLFLDWYVATTHLVYVQLEFQLSFHNYRI